MPPLPSSARHSASSPLPPTPPVYSHRIMNRFALSTTSLLQPLCLFPYLRHILDTPFSLLHLFYPPQLPLPKSPARPPTSHHAPLPPLRAPPADRILPPCLHPPPTRLPNYPLYDLRLHQRTDSIPQPGEHVMLWSLRRNSATNLTHGLDTGATFTPEHMALII
ncbi:hypothetical protein P167DRAFT_609999 [Morchella conica CCBAS932]|uniref:Uncharacterized protein n=1 Tax=Morchella conica CCBAS932 TaxID=1392247 RepID=A0A3N4KLC0_9PEZI|nr:hypothetical protein P167DRAFT_609999 [Morchella conica CCBAS932]